MSERWQVIVEWETFTNRCNPLEVASLGRARWKCGAARLDEVELMLSSAMKCPLCGYEKSHKHGLTSIGTQRYFCPKCRQTFTETFDTLYYRHQVSEEDVRIVLQSHAEGSSLRGISRISGLAYDTVVSPSASSSAQSANGA